MYDPRWNSIVRGPRQWVPVMQVSSSSAFNPGRWLVLFSVLSTASCSGGGAALNPVKGQVLYKGAPLESATVTFHLEGEGGINAVYPVGLTKPDGTFSLITGRDEGAPAGKYVVTFICAKSPGEAKGKKVFSTAPPQTPDIFGGAYANPKTSQFKVEVKKGPNELEPFKLN
jgi:hypothetical protein